MDEAELGQRKRGEDRMPIRFVRAPKAQVTE
jgi:hypothetical protein